MPVLCWASLQNGTLAQLRDARMRFGMFSALLGAPKNMFRQLSGASVTLSGAWPQQIRSFRGLRNVGKTHIKSFPAILCYFPGGGSTTNGSFPGRSSVHSRRGAAGRTSATLFPPSERLAEAVSRLLLHMLGAFPGLAPTSFLIVRPPRDKALLLSDCTLVP